MKNTNQTQIIQAEETKSIMPMQDEAERLIAMAIDKNVPVETMEKLLAMRRELKAEKAKEEYTKSLANFQSQCPIIKKGKNVNFTSKRTGMTTNYNYAPIESIIEQVKDILKENGFSYTFTSKTNGHFTITCRVTHIAGHSEESEISVPISSDESRMNAMQQVASAMTYAKRYTFCNIFGISTGDEDNDGTSVETQGTQTKPPSNTKQSEGSKVAKDTCSECHAPSGRSHATKCSLNK